MKREYTAVVHGSLLSYTENEVQILCQWSIRLLNLSRFDGEMLVKFEDVLCQETVGVVNRLDVAEPKFDHRTASQGVPWAKEYCTDGYLGYLDVVYPGQHVRNVHNKNDTFTVEGINADLRHYLPVLARRVRCFCRRLETLIAVVAVFVDAYNKFGDYKAKHRIPVVHRSHEPNKRLHKFRDCPLGLVDFL